MVNFDFEMAKLNNAVYICFNTVLRNLLLDEQKELFLRIFAPNLLFKSTFFFLLYLVLFTALSYTQKKALGAS